MLDRFYETINKIYNSYENPKILIIGKIFSEIFFDRLVIDKSNITLYFIEEPPLNHSQSVIKSTLDNYSKYNTTYSSYIEFKKWIDNSTAIYDIIFVDTVHYKECNTFILQNCVRLAKYFLIYHDTIPKNYNWTIPIRFSEMPWCGQTYQAFYNFYLNNIDNTYIVEDNFVGYGIIKIRNHMCVNYPIIKISFEDYLKLDSFIDHDYFKTSILNTLLI